MHSRFMAVALVVVLVAHAQDPTPMPFFPKSDYFRTIFEKPKSSVQIQEPVKLQDYVVGDKLELSLRAYLELVAANNTDIAISRLTIETARNAITRSYSPFDPLGTASFLSTRNTAPTTTVLAGANTLKTLNQPLNLAYSQTLMTGTQYNVSFFGGKSTTNDSFTVFNPQYSTQLRMDFTQPLIRGRGTYIQKLPIMVARSRLRQTEHNLKDTLLRLFSQAELIYWRAIELRENLRVQERALDLAAEFLKRSRRELELGAISRLDIYQPEFQFAQAQANVTQNRYLVAQQDDAIRRQIGADLDPMIRKLPIVLTEAVAPPTNPQTIDPEVAVNRALAARPDLRAAMQALDVDDLTIQQASNALKPDFSLSGRYISQGRGGTFLQRQNVFTETGQTTVSRIIPGGIGDSLDQLFGFGFPLYEFGVRLRLPIRDRSAQANLADALVSKKRDALTVRTTEQQIRLDVLTAVNQVEASKDAVELQLKSLDFARKRLDAENKRYELGTSQIFLVLQAQTDQITAEAQVVTQSVNYRRNLLNLLRMTGELLDERGILIQ
ncbi:MAG: TolC family protein [Bryobacteraceae bacterium]